MQPLTFKYEKRILESGVHVVVGCDEVGRGALAGPIVGAAVVFPNDMIRVPPEMRRVMDSKQLNARLRTELAAHIKRFARAWCVRFVSASSVDRFGIQKANMQVLQRAVETVVEQLALPQDAPVRVLVDGRVRVPGIPYLQDAIVRGDGSVFSIAAASILAKVARDDYMERQSQVYPEYGFEQHKGYGSSMHRAQIKRLGMTTLHRQSFCTRIDEWGD